MKWSYFPLNFNWFFACDFSLQRGFKLRKELAHSATNGSKTPDSLYVLEQTPQVQGLHTFIRWALWPWRILYQILRSFSEAGHLVRQCNTDLSILRWMLQYEENVLCLLMSIMNSWPMSDYCELVQILYIFMSLRNRETPRDEFIFYSKRLMRLLFEYALSMLPHKVRKSLIFH